MSFLSYTIIYIMLVKKYTEACVKIIIYGGIFFERIYLNNTGEIPHKKAIKMLNMYSNSYLIY